MDQRGADTLRHRGRGKAYFEQLPEEKKQRCRVAEAYTVTVSQTKYRDIRKPRR